MRLVLIKDRTYAVYENKQCIAEYHLEKDAPVLTAEEVENLRIIEHKSLA